MNQEATTTEHSALYRHTGCDQWGLAILAWENESKRAYQFQDGKLRVFKRGYYHFFEEVDRPVDRVPKILSTLERGLDVSNARLEARRARRAADQQSATGITLQDQVWLFARLYEGGFAGETWVAKQRGAGVKRRLKRHRDPAIAQAQSALSLVELDRLIAAGQHQEIISRAKDVLSKTDLVTKTETGRLRCDTDEQARELATALRHLLHGDAPYMMRFEHFVAALARVIGKEPSWQLATALPALVFPDRHICIRPTAFRAQAAWMAPRLGYVKRPNAPLYQRFLRMGEMVREELKKSGQTPRDLLDVHDFMHVTLRPSARKQYNRVDSARVMKAA